MIMKRIKFYHLRKKFVKVYKKELQANKLVNEFKLDSIFDVKMHLPMIELYDVLDNDGVNKLIKKIYKLKNKKNYEIEIYYINHKFKNVNYIQPQYDHNSRGILAKIKFLSDSLIEDIDIVWTQTNNEEAVIIYEIRFKKWINKLNTINKYIIENIKELKHFLPTIIYKKDFSNNDNEIEIYNMVCNTFYSVIQKKVISLFYSHLGKKFLLPILNKYVVDNKNKTINKYLQESYLGGTYIYSKDRTEKSNIYLVDSFDEYRKEYNEFIFGSSYSPGSNFLYYFSKYRMEFYYQVFNNIEINILEQKMGKYLNSHKRNIKISDYKWLINKVRQLGEKRLYDISRRDNDNMYGYSKRLKEKKFINYNTYSKKFENVYKDNLNYIKEMNNVNYNYKIYIITIITLALTILGTFFTLKDNLKADKTYSTNTLINNEMNKLSNEN